MPSLRPADRAFFADEAVVGFQMYALLDKYFNRKPESYGALRENFHRKLIPYMKSLQDEANGVPQFDADGKQLRNRFPVEATAQPVSTTRFWLTHLRMIIKVELFNLYKAVFKDADVTDDFVAWHFGELSRKMSLPSGSSSSSSFKSFTGKEFPLKEEAFSILQCAFEDSISDLKVVFDEVYMSAGYDADVDSDSDAEAPIVLTSARSRRV